MITYNLLKYLLDKKYLHICAKSYAQIIFFQTTELSATGLQPATSFAAVIYSANAKGRGELVSLQAYTLKDHAEKRTGKMDCLS